MNTRLTQRVGLGVTLLLLHGFGVAACSTESDGGSKAAAGNANAAGTGGNVAHAGSSNGAGGSANATAGSANQAGTTSAGAVNTGGVSTGGATSDDRCSAAGLTWKTAQKTWYTSYPDPGSEECIKYNGCTWAGQFSACDGKLPEAWVSAHNIVAAFPDYDTLALHDLCLKSGDKTLIVTVLDTCGDADCDGCCTQNKGSADELIDLESYTNERWGLDDGKIQWADLGPTSGDGCK
jgi:hypothetical protein